MEKIEILQTMTVSEAVKNDSLFTIDTCFSIPIDKDLREAILENIPDLEEINFYDDTETLIADFTMEAIQDTREELGEIVNLTFNNKLKKIIEEIIEEYKE